MAYVKQKDGIYYCPRRRRTMEHRGCATSIYWSPSMLNDLRRWFPTTLNNELAEIFGVSPRTLIRKARALGLVKDPHWLAEIWEERRLMAQIRSKQLGHPGTFKPGNIIGREYRFKKKEICG